MIKKDLKIGKVYSIHHKRKGHFVAQLINVVPAWEGDEEDEVFLQVKYDVREGTAQYGLATQPSQKVRVSNLRPSLIHTMEPTDEQKWLMEVKVPEEEEKPDKSLMGRLKGLIH